MNWDAMMPNYGTPPITLVSGQGSQVTDDQGRTYTDLLGGIAVNIFGHNHPAIVDAVTAQVTRLAHTSNLYANQPAMELAAKLRSRAPGHKVFLCNSGTEANEAALKTVRKNAASQGRGDGVIIAFQNAFHGRSSGALALTWNSAYKEGFGPLPDQIVHVPFNDVGALEAAFEQHDVVGVFAEPVQGEGGIHPMRQEVADALQRLCDGHNALLVMDEIQAGMGRCGAFFAHETLGLRPDIITLAKGLGGGLPIGATLVADEIAAIMGPGTHGSTFGGNAVACAAACAVMDGLTDTMVGDVARKGALVRDALAAAGIDSRGQGLLLGIPVPDAGAVVAKMREHGFLVGVAGKQTVRLAPPLTVTEDELMAGIHALVGIVAPVPA